MVYPCVCWSIFFFLWWGTPQVPRLCVYPDRRADIWSPHEPQAPMSNMEHKTSNFLSGLLQMCARSPHISVLEPYIIYHTLCLVLHPSILVWLPNISPVPTRPPTLRSLYHPLTWLHTNEILHTGSIISVFFLFSPPSWYVWRISLSVVFETGTVYTHDATNTK